ncbi:MAG: choice-of-anchor I domain-containing protein [Pseudanabaena sp.]
MYGSRFILILPAVALVSFTSTAIAQPDVKLASLARFKIPGSAPEIIAATPDGNKIVYINSKENNVGFINIQDASKPQVLGFVNVANVGEPTSVVVTPDGKYAIASIFVKEKPGQLLFFNISERKQIASLTLPGIGPDSIAITPDGKKLVVAIEDEEDTEKLPGKRPGTLVIVNLDYKNFAKSSIQNIAINLNGIRGVNFPTDPQPEYVAISPDGKTAAVTLQENNAIAIIDLNSASVTRIFSAGTVTQLGDLTDDDKASLTEKFTGRREPDGIAFTLDGKFLVTANEGDTDRKTFGDNDYSGGRGWSIFDIQGRVIYDSGNSVEALAIKNNFYPLKRSSKRGIELEGVVVANIGGKQVAFITSERGNFLVAYDISSVRKPVLLGIVPTGKNPEGVTVIPSRNLVLTANEGDGTIDIIQVKP